MPLRRRRRSQFLKTFSDKACSCLRNSASQPRSGGGCRRPCIGKSNIFAGTGFSGGAKMQRCAGTIACLVLLGILSVVAFGSFSGMALPPIPMRTQGHALDQGGSPLPLGTPIRTFVDGVNYTGGRFPGDTMAVQDGTGSFAVLTAGNSKTNANASDTPTVQEGANLGDTILYAAGDFTVATPVFQETSTCAPETIVTQHVHLGSAPSTPQILKIEGIVTQPAQGGDQFVVLCNPTGDRKSVV